MIDGRAGEIVEHGSQRYYQMAIGSEQEKRPEDQLLNIILLDSVRLPLIPAPKFPDLLKPTTHAITSVYYSILNPFNSKTKSPSFSRDDPAMT